MSDLVVLAFDSEGGALQLRDRLLSLQKQQIIQLADAAIVVRRVTHSSPFPTSRVSLSPCL